jgi:hypothetical protein
MQAVETTPEAVEIWVSDTGVGIDSSDHRAIFELFTRLKYVEKSEIRGVGIGLALSKYLVEEMEGNIGVNNLSSGGTTFWIRFRKGKLTPTILIDDQIEHPAGNKKIAIAQTISLHRGQSSKQGSDQRVFTGLS